MRYARYRSNGSVGAEDENRYGCGIENKSRSEKQELHH